ncbi:50S ribosomal protein L3 N(5)-glutamine methyltransferase [Nitrobacter sp.]|uniref:50S ribosomal protein L3 N(5)-glutamine methyltransferase n=1 Tax=Nitrobacter sp. TaxID=29420 RepID=UPI003F64AD32
MAKTAARGGHSEAATRSSAKKRRPARATAKSDVTAAATELATIFDYVGFAAARLTRARVTFAHGTTDPVAEAAFLVGEAMNLHPDEVEPNAARRVPKAAAQRILGWVEQRITTRKPAAYLVKRMYMRGLPFYVDERVIVPRSFIGEILDSHFGDDHPLRLRDPAAVTRVLDLCTGSGCLAILAARAFPDARIDAADLSEDALAVAARNVREHSLENRITLLQGDLFAALRDQRYDLIISNPPYVDAKGMAGLPRECLAEPRMAFDGGADGIDLVRRIIDGAKAHLAPGGGLLCEVGRCKPAIEKAYPRAELLWLDTEESEGEVFWLEAVRLADVVSA